jgi:hypothetical protein
MLFVKSIKRKQGIKPICSQKKQVFKNRTGKSRNLCNKTLKGGSGSSNDKRKKLVAKSKTLDAMILEFEEVYSNLDMKNRDQMYFKFNKPVLKLHEMIATRKLQSRLSDLKGKSMSMPVEDEVELAILLRQIKPAMAQLVKQYPKLKQKTAANKQSMFPSVPSEEPGEELKFPSPPKSGNKPKIDMDPDYVKYAFLFNSIINDMQTNYQPRIMTILTKQDIALHHTINGPTPVNYKQKELLSELQKTIPKLLAHLEKNQKLKK